MTMEGGKDEQDSLLRLEEKEEVFRFQLEDDDKNNKNEQAPPTPVEENPFAVAGRQADAVQQGVMDDPFYSPEEQQSNPNTNPAPTQSGAPPWSQGQVEADKRLEDIARREKELQEREAALKLQEEEQERQRNNAGRTEDDRTRKNFPPCYPLVRNDIKSDIPAHKQSLVKHGFVCWILAEIGYVFNFTTVFMLTLTGNMAVSSFLMNCLATAGGIPLSWIMWYQALYHAAQTDAAVFAHLKFFFHFGFHVLFCALAFLSPPIVGSFNAGLFTMIYEFENKDGGIHKFFGFLCLINTVVWLGCGLLSLWILQWTFRMFRSGGGVEATQQAGAAALIAASASVNTFGATATTQKPASLP